MKNKDLFEQANDDKSKEALRYRYQQWCYVNGRTSINPQTLREFLEEDVEEVNEGCGGRE